MNSQHKTYVTKILEDRASYPCHENEQSFNIRELGKYRNENVELRHILPNSCSIKKHSDKNFVSNSII